MSCQMSTLVAVLCSLYMFSASVEALDIGTLTLYGEKPIALGEIGQRLLGELSDTVHAANATLLVTKESSYHMFATNRTEFCHYHPAQTVQRVLYGGGQFYVTYGEPVPQAVGDSFVIPDGEPHAFDGQLHGPSIVLVQWTPPYKDHYIIPTTGCKDMN